MQFSDGVQFAVEAKGFGDSSISSSAMLTHKDQSRRGPLPVHFSIAAISYNLFNKVRCKYYDPVNDKIKFNSDLNNRLLNLYYRGAFEFLDQNYFRIERGSIKDVPCYFIDVIGQGTPFSLRFGDNLSFQLILMEQMKEFTLDLHSKNPRFLEQPISGSSFYLDADGIGFAIRPFGRMEA